VCRKRGLLWPASLQTPAARASLPCLRAAQAPVAQRLIEEGARAGHWVFLANCHLMASWLPALAKIVDGLEGAPGASGAGAGAGAAAGGGGGGGGGAPASAGGSLKAPHPRFRLWLSSAPSEAFPISILQVGWPAARKWPTPGHGLGGSGIAALLFNKTGVRSPTNPNHAALAPHPRPPQRGVKMTTEPPKGLRANLQRLYQSVPEASFSAPRPGPRYQRLLFALAFFHSALLERRKFRALGFNAPYDFNDTDFA
jgi:dynein heavy chain, axonemal